MHFPNHALCLLPPAFTTKTTNRKCRGLFSFRRLPFHIIRYTLLFSFARSHLNLLPFRIILISAIHLHSPFALLFQLFVYIIIVYLMPKAAQKQNVNNNKAQRCRIRASDKRSKANGNNNAAACCLLPATNAFCFVHLPAVQLLCWWWRFAGFTAHTHTHARIMLW